MNALYLHKLSLYQYKNYPQLSVAFSPQLNAIVGLNGIGKSNLLDAIYTLSFTKGYFSKNDLLAIQYQKDACRIEAYYGTHEGTNKDEKIKVACILKAAHKKEIYVNDVLVKRYADFIGTLPIVLIAPDDIDLINGVSEQRRHFVDKLISQVNQPYLHTLIEYYKIIEQKKVLLKQGATSANQVLLDIYHTQLQPLALRIFEIRVLYLNRLITYAKELYNELSMGTYAVELRYESQLLYANWQQLVQTYEQKEYLIRRTLFGIHKDDLVCMIDGRLYKDVASQGQKKSLLLALKIASLKILAEEKQMNPILLLDDIFEKLDEGRLYRLFEILKRKQPLQMILTDVDKHRINTFCQKINLPCLFIHP